MILEFNIFKWILGYSLTKLANSATDKITLKEFSDKLNITIYNWSKELPENCYINPSSIFPNFDARNEYLIELQKKIINNDLPSKDDWFNAIYQQWKLIKNEYGDDAQDFYKLDEEIAKKHLDDLSKRLFSIGQTEDKIFKKATLNKLDDIIKKLDLISAQSNKTTISSKIEIINEVKKSLSILKVFWPLAPMFTKNSNEYDKLHKIVETATIEVHHSYDVITPYAKEYEIFEDVKETKQALITGINDYLMLVDGFYSNNLKKDFEPQDIAELTYAISGLVNRWRSILILIKEKLKIEIEDE